MKFSNVITKMYLCSLTWRGGFVAAHLGGERKVRATQSTVLSNGKLSATARLKVTENDRPARGKGEKVG